MAGADQHESRGRVLIPRDFITEWRHNAPWAEDAQVEQDLIISRALVDIFNHSVLSPNLAFRGGTALFKLYLDPVRYSEDIDLVQVKEGPIGPVMNGIREVLNPWLGDPSWEQTEGRVTFRYRFESEDGLPLRLKVEINSREHFCLYGYKEHLFSVESRWFRGSAKILTYELEELLGTKLRALYQRRKGRDLFDLSSSVPDTMCVGCSLWPGGCWSNEGISFKNTQWGPPLLSDPVPGSCYIRLGVTVI